MPWERNRRDFCMSIRRVRPQPEPALPCRLRHVLSVGASYNSPPKIKRQHGSSLWPPDPQSNFLYIDKSPQDLARLLNDQGIMVLLPDHTLAMATPENVSYYMWSNRNRHGDTAYKEWLVKWGSEVSKLLPYIPLSPQRQRGERTYQGPSEISVRTI